jgi:Rrf2 family iron-sulfur cluster assembly transcriptional regulator
MLSNSCRYGIRALIYIASQPKDKGKTGIKQISRDLGLPTPFLAKILQQLAKQKILMSLKGPHGGFSLLKDPGKISLLDIVNTIDGDGLFTNCIIHNSTCRCVDREKDPCPVHDDYANLREELIKLFSSTTVNDLVKKAGGVKKVII